MINKNKNLLKSLRLIRASLDLSQEEMAKNIGIKYSSYVRIETGRAEMTASNLESISNFSKIPVQKILNGLELC